MVRSTTTPSRRLGGHDMSHPSNSTFIAGLVGGAMILSTAGAGAQSAVPRLAPSVASPPEHRNVTMMIAGIVVASVGVVLVVANMIALYTPCPRSHPSCADGAGGWVIPGL